MRNSKTIFNVVLNGKDVNTYNQMPQGKKVEWIKKNTNQKDENLINTFVYGKDFSERIPKKVTNNSEPIVDREVSSSDNNARQKPKGRKDKGI